MSDMKLLYELLQEKEQRQKESKLFHKYFTPNTPFSIEYYKKHFEFFKAGSVARQVLLIAGNRIGKTESGGLYELTCHAINWYSEWWPGRKLPSGKDLLIWVCGDTKKTCRDILQKKLLGDSLAEMGTGLIPKKYIQRITRSSGTAESVDTIYIDRIGGGTCQIVFKSYDSGRDTFQGTEVDFILLDEEPPEDVYTECLLRTMTNKGMLRLTFTPLKGMTKLIEKFIEADLINDPNKKTITATWDDVPHLTDEDKKELLASIPEYQRDARSKGIPQLGSGAIYRVALEDIQVKPFEIPRHFKKSFGLDVGFNTTAAVWIATDPDSGVTYIYSEMKAVEKQPHEYARTMSLRGPWIKGVIDPAANNRNQHDGEQIMQLLIAEGVKIFKADNAVEAGIYKVWEMLHNGKLKIFNNCEELFKEYRVYQRDEKGNVVKKNDHFMDAMRYAIMSGLDIAKSEKDIEDAKRANDNLNYNSNSGSNSWMS